MKDAEIPEKMKGVVEMDETYVVVHHKGRGEAGQENKQVVIGIKQRKLASSASSMLRMPVLGRLLSMTSKRNISEDVEVLITDICSGCLLYVHDGSGHPVCHKSNTPRLAPD